jgi:hypothetical protein
MKLQDENDTVIKDITEIGLYHQIFLKAYTYQLRNWLDYEIVPDSVFEENIDVELPDNAIYVSNGVCKLKNSQEYLRYDPYENEWR